MTDNPSDAVRDADDAIQEELEGRLDEEVARHMVAGFGGVITQLTDEQASYINVSVAGPYKPESYKY